MDRLWKTDGDYCMLLLRLAGGLTFALHGGRLIAMLTQAHGLSLSLAGGAVELLAALALACGFLARLSAAALLSVAVAGLIAFGNSPQGRGHGFYVLAAALLWAVVIHGAGPYSIDRWLMRHVEIKRV